MKPNKVWVFSDLIEKNKRQFKVPVYQRNYDWSTIECEKLFYDILHAFDTDKKHFTGTIVYIVDNTTSTLDEVLIIDGQQRLTTLYILLKTLLDYSNEMNSVRVKEEIEEVIFNRHCDEVYKIKLKPIKSDNEQLKYLVENRIDEMDRNSHIYKNYEFFKVKIKESLDAGYELRDVLDGIKKLEMVEIVLDVSQGDEPQKIFESINSTGLELSLADLIRNYLLMDDANQDYLYDYYWQPIEKNVGYANLGEFVITFLNSQLSRTVNSKNAYRCFKEHCEAGSLSHEDVLKELKRDSKYYGTIIGVNSTSFKREIVELLQSFYAIKQTTINPLLFRILRDYEDSLIDDETIINVLDYLLTYLVRITACEINKNLAKFFNSFYSRVIQNEASYENYYENFVYFLNSIRTNDRMPTDKEFRDALIYKPIYKKPICKFLLATIENSTHERLDTSNLTIEHILPQKENAAAWKAELGSEYEKVYETYLHTLGNLTITGYNSELGTKPFSEKKELIRNNSRANILNECVLSVDKWNEISILKRAKSLAGKLVEAFDYVNVGTESPRQDSALYFSVDCDFDLSNTKPSGCSLIGEQFTTQSWSDLLTKIISTFYDLDSKALLQLATVNYSIPRARESYITNDRRLLRKPKQIENTGIYYETNLSANNVLSFIKALLDEYGLETDDFMFSLTEMPFDIKNESTWEQGAITTGKLFYCLFEDLVKRELITAEEIERLKDKAYTKSLFRETDYPALANNRTDNRGNSARMRYRSVPIKFNGSDIYVSTQFFESDRNAIIDWFKSHQ